MISPQTASSSSIYPNQRTHRLSAVTQVSSQEQSQEQYITIEEIHEKINRLMTSTEEKERIEERVEEFELELEDENPDKDNMLDIIPFVRETSTQLASRLGMVALQRGVDLLDAI
ncbi:MULTISPECIES: hypothetical protein [Halobacteriaceae]|uniref:hypothetical protein n=1 Tax=Halobacteriaceae TaxID=2236 RepID=UPI0011873306|nr:MULTISPECIES: hypothetical protein [Halobacteriaceae]MDR5657829.1 hypothetical protein [Halodesulfurarchaeum sp. HSR-GB]